MASPAPDPHRSVAELLRDLATEHATGCVVVEHRELDARVWLRDGRIVAATAPGARARLGHRLVGAQLITPAQLTTALGMQRRRPDSPRLGELLVDLGLVDADALAEVLREQTLDSIAVAVGWPDPAWRIVPGATADEDVPLHTSVENALMEATRRLDEWSVISETLGSLDARLDLVPGGAANLALTPDEWAMLTRVDGRACIADLAADAGYSAFQAARIVFSLATAGVVRVLPETHHEPAPEPDPDPSAQSEGGDGAPPPPAKLAADADAESRPEPLTGEARDAMTALFAELAEGR